MLLQTFLNKCLKLKYSLTNKVKYQLLRPNKSK
nr:MAG TPA: hypothetical protein [Caudoviricetes sp.]